MVFFSIRTTCFVLKSFRVLFFFFFAEFFGLTLGTAIESVKNIILFKLACTTTVVCTSRYKRVQLCWDIERQMFVCFSPTWFVDPQVDDAVGRRRTPFTGFRRARWSSSAGRVREDQMTSASTIDRQIHRLHLDGWTLGLFLFPKN